MCVCVWVRVVGGGEGGFLCFRLFMIDLSIIWVDTCPWTLWLSLAELPLEEGASFSVFVDV